MRARLDALVVVLAVLVVHGRDVGFGFTSLDDLSLLEGDREFLSSPGAWWRAFGRTYFHVLDAAHAYYRPVVTASYAIDARVFGFAPGGHHVTNVALHGVAALLLFALLSRTTMQRAVVLLAACAFAVHPIVVPAVAWIPGRNDVLLGVFVLGSVLAYARSTMLSLVVHLLAFALAMFTKETAVIVPVVALLWARLVEPDAPYRSRALAVATGAGWIAVLSVFAWARQRALAGAAPSLDFMATVQHLPVLVGSAAKILCPFDLAPIATQADSPRLAGVVALAALAIAWYLARRRGPAMPLAVFGAMLYVLALVPTIFVGGTLTLENRLYLPAVGLVFVVAEIVDRAPLERGQLLAFGGVVVIALGGLALGYGSAFRDPLAFGKAAVAGAPRSSLAHFTLGQARHLRGDENGALREYAEALALDPSEPIVHNNVAVIYMKNGEFSRAEAELEAELRVNPGYSTALENLARVRKRLGK